eukprot:11117013-Ditylum_brightwellii.AAC.3
MDCFEAKKLTSDTLDKLNSVHLFLGVITLADITNDEGTHIMSWALTGSSHAMTLLSWPNQGRPFERCWVQWRHYLKQCYAPGTSQCHCLHMKMKLQTPLGEWLLKQPYTAQQQYYDQDDEIVYKICNGAFHVYSQVSGRFNRFQVTNQTITELPLSAVFTLVKKFGQLWYCKDPLAQLQQQLENEAEEASQTDSTLKEYVKQQPGHAQRLLGTLKADEIDTTYWIDAINDNKVTITTNGSVAENRGYFATVL